MSVLFTLPRHLSYSLPAEASLSLPPPPAPSLPSHFVSIRACCRFESFTTGKVKASELPLLTGQCGKICQAAAENCSWSQSVAKVGVSGHGGAAGPGGRVVRRRTADTRKIQMVVVFWSLRHFPHREERIVSWTAAGHFSPVV